ncbi:MAG: hypothetical protein H7Y22_06835 [Gemmatimonadaceae bacterium]|nr:hypothetical protein [Gloeobacterales cyanobacterium ES-bin-141]
MIHHISISAEQPQHVAGVLAELLGGAVMPFPGHPDCYIALALDDLGTMVEVLPMGTVLTPGASDNEETQFVPAGITSGYVPTHAAISVALEQDAIERIAAREGWRCERFTRGQDFFTLIEFWVENRQLVELLPPADASRYTAFFHPENLRKMLAAESPVEKQPVGAGC